MMWDMKCEPSQMGSQYAIKLVSRTNPEEWTQNLESLLFLPFESIWGTSSSLKLRSSLLTLLHCQAIHHFNFYQTTEIGGDFLAMTSGFRSRFFKYWPSTFWFLECWISGHRQIRKATHMTCGSQVIGVTHTAENGATIQIVLRLVLREPPASCRCLQTGTWNPNLQKKSERNFTEPLNISGWEAQRFFSQLRLNVQETSCS